MEPNAASPTAAAATTPTPVSAVDAAVASGKTSDYRTARRAERLGKPLDAVAAKPAAAADPAKPDADADPDPTETLETPEPAAAAAAAAPPKLSRKERDQQDANERVRKAVDAATADLRAENARLKASAAPRSDAPPDPAAPAPPADKKTPEYKRIMALAGAPKLADFDSVEEHAFAAAEFIDSVRTTERDTAARTRADHESLTAAQHQRVDTFLQKLDATKKADPEFTKKISPEVIALKPFGALKPGESGGPLNVVAEQIMDSPIAPAVMLHLSQHPEALAALVAMPPSIAAIRDALTQQRAHIRHIVQNFNRLEGKLDAPSAAAADPDPEPKTISDAPDPAPTLGSKPVETGDPITRAVKSGNTRTYRELRRRERAASLVRR